MLSETNLVSTSWLQDHLGMDSLRLFDTTVDLQAQADGTGYLPISGYDHWVKDHIPGAAFLDVIHELSDSENSVPFMMPPAEKFGAAIQSHGVADDSIVVLYGRGSPMWATRVWWMLLSVGFRNVAVLDGGWEKWNNEGRRIESQFKPYPLGELSIKPKPELWVGKQEMREAESDEEIVVINTLSSDVYSGKLNRYGRPGHLRGSYNVYYGSILDPENSTFLPVEDLKARFSESGALNARKVYTYCGGGISATMDCLALHACGQLNVAVYDGSMSEWARDESLELVIGNDP